VAARGWVNAWPLLRSQARSKKALATVVVSASAELSSLSVVRQGLLKGKIDFADESGMGFKEFLKLACSYIFVAVYFDQSFDDMRGLGSTALHLQGNNPADLGILDLIVQPIPDLIGGCIGIVNNKPGREDFDHCPTSCLISEICLHY
jgi:hypothetical protein